MSIILEVTHKFSNYSAIAIKSPHLTGLRINCGTTGIRSTVLPKCWVVIQPIPGKPPILWVHTNETFRTFFETKKEQPVHA